mgnify:CR=1 FL=1
MTQIIPLKAEPRARAGKGTARATRRLGLVPAVIYGNKETPLLLAIDKFTVNRVLHQPGFFTHLFDITVGATTTRVLPRDVQLDPITDLPLHLDFLRVGADTRITLDIPCEFLNVEKAPGIKKGGVLNVVRHSIEVSCLAANIPEQIVIDLAGADIGDSIHISTITLPEGVTPTIQDRDFTIATIAAPSGLGGDEG